MCIPRTGPAARSHYTWESISYSHREEGIPRAISKCIYSTPGGDGALCAAVLMHFIFYSRMHLASRCVSNFRPAAFRRWIINALVIVKLHPYILSSYTWIIGCSFFNAAFSPFLPESFVSVCMPLKKLSLLDNEEKNIF